MAEIDHQPPRKGRPVVHQMAIVGNVSVGKTSIFDSLCRHSEHSVNIPGSTVEVTRGVMAVGRHGAPRKVRHRCSACGRGRRQRGQCGSVAASPSAGECPGAQTLASLGVEELIHIYDTPGSATLAANGEDEIVARDLILSDEINSAMVVADAKNLRRSVAFFLEMAEYGLPLMVALNMMDEAEALGIEIDDRRLAESLQVPVVRTVAVEKRGIRRLAEIRPVRPLRPLRFSQAIESAVEEIGPLVENPALSVRGLALLLLCRDRGARRWVAAKKGEETLRTIDRIVDETTRAFATPIKEILSAAFFNEAKRIVDRAVVSSPESPSPLVRFGHFAQHPVYGTLIGLAVLVLAYFWVGEFGATFVVDTLSTKVFDGVLLPLSERLVSHIPSVFVRDALLDPDFGLLPTGLFLALGVVLPILFCFYTLQAVLEDSGYLPRLAVLFDRLFRWLGLNGQSFIPLVLGFSCITMAVITTRLLPTRRERTILTLMLVLGIPCAPLLAVLMVILRELPIAAGLTVFGIITSQILLAGVLASRFLPGAHPDLILEIPIMRIPRPLIVLKKTWRRTWHFLREAVPVFLLASFLVFVFDRAGGLVAVETFFRPFINGLLGLPDEFVQVFIKTAIRRENGATELLHVRTHFDNVQLVVTMLVMTFLIPCINTTIVIFKERGFRTAVIILTAVVCWAIAVGTAVNFICRALGVTFS